jgi:hypothetical protein
MVSATRVPNTAAVLDTVGHHGLPRVFGSIDRTIGWFSSKLRLQREAACRFPSIWLGRRLVPQRGHLVVQSHDIDVGSLCPPPFLFS